MLQNTVKRMTDILSFGKYKGTSLYDLVNDDIGYANWIIRIKPACASKYQINKLTQLINNIIYDDIINNAYYNSELYKEFKCNVEVFITHKYSSIPKDIIDSIIDDTYICEILNTHTGTLYSISTIVDNVEYKIMTPTLNDFDTKFQKLAEMQRTQIENDKTELRPSRRISMYWAHLSDYVNIKYSHKHTNESGKWMLFLNKIKEDENGYTELDRCWKLIIDNYKDLFEYDGEWFSAKVSTRRPNPNSNSPTDGVIILYCSEKYKTDMINKIRRLYKYDKPIYWKLDSWAGNKYSKDGIKSSSDVSYP